MISRKENMKGQGGQVLILCACYIVLLLLFVGLAIDFGMAFVTRARLGKAADAAALAGAKHLSAGQAQATAVAQSTFALNYHPVVSASSPAPVVNVTYSTDPSTGFMLTSVQANATNSTSFIGLLPAFRTLTVGSSATASRARVVATLVLDRSASMGPDGGEAAMPTAVTSFLNIFDDTTDSVALVSFASDVTVNVPMLPGTQTGSFKAPITAAVANMSPNGHTFSVGGLQQAFLQNSQKASLLPGNVLQVVVFFTDGLANIVQDTLVCNGATDPTNTNPPMKNSNGVSWNYGGYSVEDGGNAIGFMVPATGKEVCTTPDGNTNNCCGKPGTFPTGSTGALMKITQKNVEAEALYRAVAVANTMRAAPNNMYVYAIGLGSDTKQENFLYQVANDPNSPTFDSTLPVGAAGFAQTPSQLNAIFQSMAYKIALRLTQ